MEFKKTQCRYRNQEYECKMSKASGNNCTACTQGQLVDMLSLVVSELAEIHSAMVLKETEEDKKDWPVPIDKW